MTTIKRLALRLSAQPLLLAQVFSSAGGALAMVMAASAMQPTQFTTFSLFMLAAQLCTGAVRSFLFQPALVETRHNRDAHIHVRVAAVGALCGGLGFLVAIAVMGIRNPSWLALLPLASTLPVATEWLRLRGMAVDDRWRVARGDALRLVATLPGIVLLCVTTDPEVYFLYVCLTYLTTVAYLASQLPPVSAHISPRRFWRQASSQLIDFMLAQLLSTIPLLVLAGFESSAYIGGIRMAQSLLGPVNLVIWASAMNLMADGATRDSLVEPVDLIRRGRRLAAALALLCLALISMALLVLYATGFSFRGADNQSMKVGVILVGSYLFTSAWTYPDTIVMRLLRHHAAVTWGRVCVVAATAAGYGIGYAIGGTDLSLIVAFIVSAMANPFAFRLPAAFIYRQYQ